MKKNKTGIKTVNSEDVTLSIQAEVECHRESKLIPAADMPAIKCLTIQQDRETENKRSCS